jgi:hypothetical protein
MSRCYMFDANLETSFCRERQNSRMEWAFPAFFGRIGQLGAHRAAGSLAGADNAEKWSRTEADRDGWDMGGSGSSKPPMNHILSQRRSR